MDHVITFERGEPREITNSDGLPEMRVTITGRVDDAEVLTFEMPEDADDTAVHQHLEWELKRRGLIPR